MDRGTLWDASAQILKFQMGSTFTTRIYKDLFTRIWIYKDLFTSIYDKDLSDNLTFATQIYRWTDPAVLKIG